MKKLKQDKASGTYWLFEESNPCFCPYQFPTLGQTLDGKASRQKEGCSSLCSMFEKTDNLSMGCVVKLHCGTSAEYPVEIVEEKEKEVKPIR